MRFKLLKNCRERRGILHFLTPSGFLLEFEKKSLLQTILYFFESKVQTLRHSVMQ